MHEIDDVCTAATSTGLDFDGETHIVRVGLSRMWKLRMALDWLLTKGSCSGRVLEIIMGHLTWSFLVRRELLSLFSTVYVFIKHHPNSSSFLWPSVRKELAHARSLLPMAFVDVGRPWSSLLTATVRLAASESANEG